MNNRRDRHTDRWKGFIEWAAEMGSGAVTFKVS
jgi:hypothetical protein